MIEVVIVEYNSAGNIVASGRSNNSHKSAYVQAYNSWRNQSVLSDGTVLAHSIQFYRSGKLYSESSKWPKPLWGKGLRRAELGRTP